MNSETISSMTEFKFNCSSCGQHILAATAWSGLEIRCPSCQCRISIPVASGDGLTSMAGTSLNHTGQTIRIEPHSAGGAYVNFMMEEGQDHVKATYGDNYERLVEVKRKYDPANLFRCNQNIQQKR